MKLEEKLLQLRKEKNMSQESLACELNITRQAISKWESGQSIPDVDNMKRLAQVFNISVDDLLNEYPISKKEYEGYGSPPAVLKLMFGFGALGLAWSIYSGQYSWVLIGALSGVGLGLILNVFNIVK